MEVIIIEVDVSRAQSYRILEMGDKAHQGEEVIIMRDGQPWLRLLPCPDYTPPPVKPRKELAAEYREKMGRPQVPYKGSANPLDKPWAYLPERELCADCLANYRKDTRKDAAGAAARGGD